MKTYSLPERAAVALEYWLGGNEILWEGRRLILGPVSDVSSVLAVGAKAEVLKYEFGQEPTREETIIGVNMSLSRFLLMISQMGNADFIRMEKVLAYAWRDKVHGTD